MTVRNAVEFVLLVENTLGYAVEPKGDCSLEQMRWIEAAKVKRKRKTNLKLYTWRNLELAVSLLFENRQAIGSPLAVFYYVEPALKRAGPEVVVNPTEVLIEEAIRRETELGAADSDYWISRLTRAFGPYRKGVYEEWVAVRMQT